MTDSTVGEAGGSPVGSLELDTVFELLASRRRRLALYTLSSLPDGVIGFAELVEEVVTLDAALRGTAVTREGYFETGSDLYHWHLPVLADIGVVDCDARQRVVRYQEQPVIERWLTRASDEELPDPCR